MGMANRTISSATEILFHCLCLCFTQIHLNEMNDRKRMVAMLGLTRNSIEGETGMTETAGS